MLICLLACVACSDETLISQKVEEGVPVIATLSFESSDPGEIETKATDLDENNPVKSLAVFIFKKKGETSERVGDVHIYTSTEIDNKKITIKTTSGERYIYAIGNYKSSLFTISDDDLNNIRTIDDLKAMTVTLPRDGENISVYDNLFLMSGSVSKAGYDIESSCMINEKGDIDGKLYLKRIMSSIQFVINGPTKKGASFVPTSWQVKKLPQKSNVIELIADCKDTGDSDYTNSKIHKSFVGTNKNEFSFLMLENRKDAKNASIISNRDDREKQDGSVENFIAADKNSTYVVLKGTYTGTTNIVNGRSDKKVEAYTTYFIHLGDWSEENKKDYTDFKIFRNNRYIYTVTVNGVDDLIVEVTITDKDLWGGEGDMYLSEDEIMTFDAHYGTTIISFKKTAIQNLINNYGGGIDNFKREFKIKAATPVNNFNLEGTKDIDWVTFKRNTEGPDNFMPYKANEADQPMNADEFKQDLYDVAMNETNNDEVIYYTCFIDEYFYPNLRLKDFVNQKSRTIQIGTDYQKNTTPSSSSSISKAAYTFSQKSIWTVYDLDKLDIEKSINGWGSESVMEGEPIAIFNNSIYKNKNITNSLLQGFSNMKGLIGDNHSWDKQVDYQTNKVFESAVEYACLNRNRDLNGNGQIDDDEIRWYLPALNQYVGFWMGLDALPVEVRLYPYTDRSDRNFIYLTSTVVKGNGLRVFWANQGSNTGYYGDNHSGDGPRPYRCVRNLRSVTGDVADFVVRSSEYGDGLYQYYTLEYLNPVAIRDNVSQPLRSHTHIEEENRLPYKFELNKGYAGIGTSKVPLKDPCPEDWRLPNQRELTVLTSEWSKNKKLLMSFTTLQWGGNFVFNSTNMNIAGDGAFGYNYRCIKDVK